MNLVDELFKVTKVLRDAGIDYAVCGGIAVSIYGAVRSTKDIDILIARADLPRALSVAEGALGPIFEDRAKVTVPEGELTLVSLAGLLEMKRMSGRPQDLADIEKLGEANGR